MNDLSGLTWNSKPAAQQNSQQVPARNTPSPGLSRQSTPSSLAGPSHVSNRPASSNHTASKASAADSFSSLLSPQTGRPNVASLSLEERQRQLNLQRSLAAGNNDPFSASDAGFWDGLGSGRGTPAPADTSKAPKTADDNLLAAFSANAPVDRSSHFSPPSRSNVTSPAGSSRGRSPAVDQRHPQPNKPPTQAFNDDDDPFGLSQLGTQKPPPSHSQAADDIDDILGDLGKPVEETLAARKRQESAKRAEEESKFIAMASGEDKALAELIDMGFDIDKAKGALAQTPSGSDVQAAIGVLLNDAHGKSSSNDRAKTRPARTGDSKNSRRHQPSNGPDRDGPAWMRNIQAPGRSSTTSPNEEEKEISQYASEIGASMWKSANTFWKAGQKRMAKAVADFQQEGDPNHPRWMRDEHPSEQPVDDVRAPQGRSPLHGASSRTAEADLLDSGALPPRQKSTGPQRDSRPSSARDAHAQHARPGEREQPPRQQQPAQRPTPQPAPRPVEKVNRRLVEEEIAQAYVSPARRKKAEPKQQPPPEPTDTLDIFSDAPAPAPPTASAPAASLQTKTTRQTAIPVRPPAPPRQTPSVPDNVLKASRTNRNAGGASFKQGDYASARSSYTTALTGLPKGHPVSIVIYCNRALTSIKTGDAKGAISDADAALGIIGVSKGEGESIDLADEGVKPMKEFFGKALLRKAEAHEHLEKWNEAAEVWREAVQAGVGGSLAIQGRNRCEKAAAPPKPAAAVPVKQKAAPPARPRPKASALTDLNGSAEGEAVKRLREQTAAAAAASDEAFALSDSVDAKLAAWKSGKSENLRGLLASLDTVLWVEAGWNKVGMGDLVLPNRVKIVYMKAIAKVHPDKLSQSATTEQRMISASVFATLNEAWDKFKKDNNM